MVTLIFPPHVRPSEVSVYHPLAHSGGRHGCTLKTIMVENRRQDYRTRYQERYPPGIEIIFFCDFPRRILEEEPQGPFNRRACQKVPQSSCNIADVMANSSTKNHSDHFLTRCRVTYAVYDSHDAP